MKKQQKYRQFTIVQFEKNPATGEDLNFNEEVIEKGIDFLKNKVAEDSFEFWAFVKHDKDKKENSNELKPSHWHIVLKFKNQISVGTIAKAFKIPENLVEFKKNENRSIESRLAYLTHEDFDSVAKNKFKYNRKDVKISDSNKWSAVDNWLKNGNPSLLKRIENIIYDRIYYEIITEPGQIKEIVDTFLINESAGKKLDLLKRANDKLNNFNPAKVKNSKLKKMNVIVLIGPSGSFKSTFARNLAVSYLKSNGYEKKFDEYFEKNGNDYVVDKEKLKKSFLTNLFFFSKSNDLLDGYKGEKVIIFDEYKKDIFPNLKADKHLSLLDNFSDGKLESRYYNKNMNEAELLILTTTGTFEDLKKAYKDIYKEQSPEFLRRINAYYYFTEEVGEKVIQIFENQNNEKENFEEFKKIKTIKNKFLRNENVKEKIKEKQSSLKNIFNLIK